MLVGSADGLNEGNAERDGALDGAVDGEMLVLGFSVGSIEGT